MVTGDSLTYIGGRGHVDIPMATDLQYRNAHKPWCSECKKTEPLNDEGLCAACVKANEVRARLAAKRAEREAATRPTPQANTTPEGETYVELPAHEVEARFQGPATLANKRGGGRPPRFDVDQAMRRYAAGEAAHTIAADLGTTAQNVYGHAHRRGIHAGQDKPDTPATPAPAEPIAPTVRAKVTRAGTHDVLITLRSTTEPLSQIKVAALLTDLLAGLSGKPKPKRPAGAPRAHRRDKLILPSPEVEDAYTAGATIKDLAEQHGVSSPTIVRHLDEHGIQRRKQKIDCTPELIEAVRVRYVDQGMTQEEVGAELGFTAKVVQGVMAQGGIPARPGAFDPDSGVRPNNSQCLKERLCDLGVTSAQVKAWALEQGLITEIRRGAPKSRLITAYVNAHRQEES